MYARGRVDGRTRRVAKKRRLPKLAFDRPPVLFLLFEKLSGVRKLTTFYLAKNDHRWVTFISLKTMTALGSNKHLCEEDFSDHF